MFLFVSCFFPTFDTEFPTPATARGVKLSVLRLSLLVFFRADDVRASCLLVLQLSRTPLIITKERNRSRPKKFFILLGFFEGTRFQRKGFRVYWQFCLTFNNIYLQFIRDYFVFFTPFPGTRLICILFTAYLRLFVVYSLFIWCSCGFYLGLSLISSFYYYLHLKWVYLVCIWWFCSGL